MYIYLQICFGSIPCLMYSTPASNLSYHLMENLTFCTSYSESHITPIINASLSLSYCLTDSTFVAIYPLYAEQSFGAKSTTSCHCQDCFSLEALLLYSHFTSVQWLSCARLLSVLYYYLYASKIARYLRTFITFIYILIIYIYYL